MIARTVDKLAADKPSFAEYFRERILYIFETTEGGSILLCLFSAIAAGIFAGNPNDLLRYGVPLLAGAVWISCTVVAGFLKQWFFAVFTIMYYMLPYIFIIVPDTAAEEGASEFQLMLSDLMKSVLLRPMRLITDDGQTFTVSLMMLAVTGFLFICGVNLRNSAKHSDFYCRTRLNQLDESE